ncbi:MAG: sugar phosphate isomerase/epimerase [Bacteroidetes bacterium]|nr:MAG: sugar phosphate isomerase/epimerase [Bacteroidota bacterium]
MKQLNRRNFLKLSGAVLAASQAPSVIAAGKPAGSGLNSNIPFQLGMASYTFREFSLEETVTMTSRLGIGKLALKSMHMPLDASSDEIRQRASMVRDAGIDLYGAGVIYMTSPDEVENAFNYARIAGMNTIIGVPEHELIALCNRKVKETGIRMAIHNHGPGDEKYPSPESIYSRLKGMDPGLGLCIDIGHTVRIGLDPIIETEKYFDRVLDIHIKDEDKADSSGNTVEIGRGIIDIPGYLQMLLRKKYSSVVSFEFEKDGKDPLPGLAESVGYVRGVLQVIA